jgi:hypothetical protein
MKRATKLFTTTFMIGTIGAAALELPVEAAPITVPAGLQNTPQPAVQTVQWRGWDSGATQYGPGGTQLGPDYDYYGPRYGSGYYRSSRGSYEGESWPASGTQYGPDYDYYGPRRGSGYYQSRRGYYEGESWPASGTQYGPDYDYYGPRYGSGPANESYAYSGAVSTGRDQSSCQRRFRSFDPSSGTYMGYDGRRHPCP